MIYPSATLPAGGYFYAKKIFTGKSRDYGKAETFFLLAIKVQLKQA